jgi:phenylalanyl-tRNA synthetase beta chain
MKVSQNWIREFLDIHKSSSEIADILTSLGLEVEGWETVKPSQVDLDKVFTGLVVECTPIPDTDHLSATKVDVGDGVIRSIVCGAPNVAAGQKVLVALPGANVFSKDGQLFTIGERKVRGVPSQGMICAQDELGVGHDHSGIMVLPQDTALGISAADWFKQPSDTIIEIGLTPNRADATNHLGVARDLAAYLRTHENPSLQINIPDVTAFPAASAAPAIQVEVQNPEACSRYTGVYIKGVQVKESPEWLQHRLLALGQRPINNVVDITNLVRMELGQPLHAFDAGQIQGRKVLVKTLPEGTVFKSLDGADRKLFAEDLMICDGAANPMCIGGVFGGAESGVTETTTEVFLESACFNAKWIRRSMLRHNLRTDAAWTFEKGVDPNGTLFALQRAALLILELAGGSIDTRIVDIYPQPLQPAKVPVAYQRIHTLIGEKIPVEKIRSILQSLEIGIENATETGLTAVIPTNKPDVTREADVVEEILRVYGLDNVPVPAQFRTSMEITRRPSPEIIRNFAADFLAANGFMECMSMSLTNANYYTGPQALWPIPAEQLVFIHNTANQGLDCMRPAMLFSALEAVVRNQNRQNADLRLFEFGKIFYQGPEKQLGEAQHLSVLMTGAYAAESWQPTAKAKADFYTLKAFVNTLLARLGISGYQETEIQEAPYQYAIKYHRGAQELLRFGAIAPAVLKKMDIKNAVYFADFQFENILKALGVNKIQFEELNKFPTVRRDLALVISKEVRFGDIRQLAAKTAKKILRDVNLFDVFEDESKLGAGKKSYAVSFLFEDPEKTLQDKEIDQVMQQLQQAFETKLQALIRK